MASMFTFLKKIFQSALSNSAWANSALANAALTNAALAWQQAGNLPENAYWLYAAPVHLVLQRDSFSLAERVPLHLDLQEANDLTHSLNTHFIADGMQFFWHQQQWFLRLQRNPNIQTINPQRATNQDISKFLPTGKGAMAWASVQNELQMLLFEHPVNLARENLRLQTVNSIWCYGGGQIADAPLDDGSYAN